MLQFSLVVACLILTFQIPSHAGWTSKFTGPILQASSDDSILKIATDSLGDIYTLGQVRAAGGLDIKIVKYNDDGSIAWAKQFDGPGHLDDYPVAIKADSSGNVYAIGRAAYINTTKMVLLKYDSNGNLLWKQFYGDDTAQTDAGDLTLDMSGQPCIVGTVFTSTGTTQYATVKYSTAGSLLWQVRYTAAPSGESAYVSKIARDSSNNVIIAGYKTDAGTGYRVVIKYNSAGSQTWLKTAQAAGDSRAASALITDSSGSIYIAGSSAPGLGGGGRNVETVKLTPTGTTSWVQRYNGPANVDDDARVMTLDGSGNVCVAGTAGMILDGFGNGINGIVVLKYTPTGIPIWHQTYEGDDGNEAYPMDIETGSNATWVVGGIKLSGEFIYRSLKVLFDDSGVVTSALVGSVESGDSAIQLYFGALLISGYKDQGGGQYAAVLGKYFPDFSSYWENAFNGKFSHHGYNVGRAMTTDASGNTYVTGTSEGVAGDLDFITIKLSPTGSQLWSKRLTGPAGTDIANAIAVDGTGNVYVTGKSLSASNGYDYLTAKYSPAGDLLWSKRYDGADHQDDSAVSIKVDAAGANLYVTGTAGEEPDYTQITTIKYRTTDGLELWRRSWSGAPVAPDVAYGMAVDASGAVVVVGQSYSFGDGSGLNSDYAVIRYNSIGTLQWAFLYDAGGTDFLTRATDVITDSSNNIYITGLSFDSMQDSGPVYSVGTVKFNSQGVFQWLVRSNVASGANLDIDRAFVSKDPLNNIYVTCTANSNSANPQWATIRIGNRGGEEWSKRVTGAYPTGIRVDTNANVYVSGVTSRSTTLTDYTVAKYSPGGTQLSLTKYDGSWHQDDVSDAITLDNSGNIYLSGSSFYSGGNDIVTLKYDKVLETEALTVQAKSSDTHSIITDANMSSGKGTSLLANSTNDFVTYGVSIPTNGNYEIRVRLKKDSSSGRFRFSCANAVAGTYTNIGPIQDLYSSTTTYKEIVLGTNSFSSGGIKSLKFLVTDKNASSTGFKLNFDYLILNKK